MLLVLALKEIVGYLSAFDFYLDKYCRSSHFCWFSILTKVAGYLRAVGFRPIRVSKVAEAYMGPTVHPAASTVDVKTSN